MQAKLADKLFWFSGWVYDFSKIATFLLVIGLIVYYFFFSVLVVRGKSMETKYIDGDVLMVNKIAYMTSKPQRGDVVAMFFPGETQKRFIKRVVGLPGDTVTVQAGRVFINGKALPEPYLQQGIETFPDSTRQLQAGEYMVFGDNRPVSSDSRAWGPVPQSFIIGKVTTKLFKVPSQQQTVY